MAKAARLLTHGEGTETKAPREVAVENGCDGLPGFLLGRPELKLRLTLGGWP